jgi:hypothetical protein
VEKKEVVTKAKSVEPSNGQESKKKAPPIRYATREEFEKADRKVNALHAGLFRRLAK